MATITQKDILSTEAIQFAMLLHAYKECSPDVQEIVNDMAEIIVDNTSSEDERTHAVDVLVEVLLPGITADVRENDCLRSKTKQASQAIQSLDEEEATFADRLREKMQEKGVNQETLAKLAGVSQPAIANILGRMCRPQQRTVQKFAEALNVDPSDLWPVV